MALAGEGYFGTFSNIVQFAITSSRPEEWYNQKVDRSSNPRMGRISVGNRCSGNKAGGFPASLSYSLPESWKMPTTYRGTEDLRA